MAQPRQRTSRLTGGFLAAAALAGMAILGWCIWPSKTTLTGDSYDIAIALYRVCNQQDQEGLQKIERKIDELQSVAAADSRALQQLRRIVADAQAGSWQAAMRETRKTLADQAPGA